MTFFLTSFFFSPIVKVAFIVLLKQAQLFPAERWTPGSTLIHILPFCRSEEA